MSNDQPPLPEQKMTPIPGPRGYIFWYSKEQLIEYGRACERAAYERAVKKCEEFEDELETKGRDLEADIAWGLARRIEDLGADK